MRQGKKPGRWRNVSSGKERLQRRHNGSRETPLSAMAGAEVKLKARAFDI